MTDPTLTPKYCMEFGEILVETINNGARRLGFFLSRQIKFLDHIIPQIKQATATLKPLLQAGDGEYELVYALAHANHGDRPRLPEVWDIDLVRHYHLEELRDSLEAMRKFGARDFLRYVLNNLEYVKPVSADTRHVLVLMAHVDAGLQAYGYEPASQDSEYRAAKAMADAYTLIYRLLLHVGA